MPSTTSATPATWCCSVTKFRRRRELPMSLDTLASPVTERVEPATLTRRDLRDLVDHSVGHSSWHQVTQADVDRFAIATGDYQWIHTAPERARRGPFGTAIAHGYLTLSLATTLISEVLEVTDAALVVNYGLDRVRFPAPLPVDALVRAEICCRQVRDVPGGIELILRLTYQVREQHKPCCVADVVYRYYDEPGPPRVPPRLALRRCSSESIWRRSDLLPFGAGWDHKRPRRCRSIRRTGASPTPRGRTTPRTSRYARPTLPPSCSVTRFSRPAAVTGGPTRRPNSRPTSSSTHLRRRTSWPPIRPRSSARLRPRAGVWPPVAATSSTTWCTTVDVPGRSIADRSSWAATSPRRQARSCSAT